MIVKYQEIVKETAKSSKSKEKVVAITVKHFFRGLKAIMKKRLLFKETGMFKTYIRKSKRRQNIVK